VLGFVDVPGHERFVRNMIAGVTGIDFALLVIAADDGPMPQTDEHLAILDLLGVARGAVALSKIDRVSETRIAEAKQEIEILLAGTGLADAPVFPVSAITGDGIGRLRRHLEDTARAVGQPAAAGHFRLAIDRSFTMPGAGLVVTGAVFSGSVRTGDGLIVSPAGIPVRVRGIHAQNRQAEQGAAGQRCALNIAGAGLRNAEIKRGAWLVAEAAHAPTTRFDARVRLLPGEAKALRHWTPVHVHLGAADVPGRVAVLETGPIAPGGDGLVQLVLDQPTGALYGDRFILRDQSAWRTIAGGRVIDPFAAARGRARPERLQVVAAFERETAADALAGLLELAPLGVDLAGFARSRNLSSEDADALYQRVPMRRMANFALSEAHWEKLQNDTLAALARGHERAPGRGGLEDATLRRALSPHLPAAVFEAAAAALANAGKVVRDGANLRLPAHRAVLAPRDAALWQRVKPLLDAAGLRPPSVAEIAGDLSLARQETERFLVRAGRIGLVIRVADNRFYTPEALLELGRMAEEIAAGKPDGMFSAADFRDRTGIGRNLAIEIVEYFDRAGFTRRTGNVRRVLKPAAEVFRPVPE
jgi:selenocysteine-specific elongation factor